MNLLAIDSAGSILSIAVSRGDEIIFTQTDAGVRYSELAMEYIDNLIKKASLKPQDIDHVLCMGGPGSFTGLRIGYSIAKGLALSLSIPFTPVPTLDCIAFPYRNGGLDPAAQFPVLAVIEARKNAWFYAFYQDGKLLKPATDGDSLQISKKIDNLTENEAGKMILTGPGAESLNNSLAKKPENHIIFDTQNRVYAKELIAIAKIDNLLDNEVTAYVFSGPEYIRKTDAELNLS